MKIEARGESNNAWNERASDFIIPVLNTTDTHYIKRPFPQILSKQFRFFFAIQNHPFPLHNRKNKSQDFLFSLSRVCPFQIQQSLVSHYLFALCTRSQRMLARAFLAFLLVATNYCEKTHAAPASEEGNHLGDHKHLLKSGKITFDSTDSVCWPCFLQLIKLKTRALCFNLWGHGDDNELICVEEEKVLNLVF